MKDNSICPVAHTRSQREREVRRVVGIRKPPRKKKQNPQLVLTASNTWWGRSKGLQKKKKKQHLLYFSELESILQEEDIWMTHLHS
jgi:predicted patatin/cPLA2 family phospholipase